MGALNNFVSIADMNAWDFWARPSSLDLAPDDWAVAEAAVRGNLKIAPDQAERLNRAIKRAACELRDLDAEIGGFRPYGIWLS